MIALGRSLLIGTAAVASTFVLAISAPSAAWHPSGQQAFDLSTPQGLYRAGCRACHAADGKGADLANLGFDVPLPDFSDCSFATREPDADWFAVTHQGGPVRGFANNMPAFYEAFSDEQIEMVVDYLRVFCHDPRWPAGELNFPRPLITEKAYPEDEFVFTVGSNTDTPAGVVGEFLYERRIGPKGQIELELPVGVRQLESDGAWFGGIGDIEVGYKQVLAYSSERGAIFSGSVAFILPTGNEERGLGRGAFIVEPFVSAGLALPRDSFVHFLFGGEISTDTSKAHHEMHWRGVVGTTFTSGRFGRAWSPMIEFLGVTVFEVEETVNALDLLPQVQVTLNTRQHVMANLGVRFPVNRTESRSTQIIFYILWEWFDGGFFDGW